VLPPRPPRREPPTRCRCSGKTYPKTLRLLLNLISQFSNITLRTSSSTFYLCLDINLSSFQRTRCHWRPQVLSSILRKTTAVSSLHLPNSHALWKLGFHRLSIAPSRLTERGSWGDNHSKLIQARWLANISPNRMPFMIYLTFIAPLAEDCEANHLHEYIPSF